MSAESQYAARPTNEPLGVSWQLLTRITWRPAAATARGRASIVFECAGFEDRDIRKYREADRQALIDFWALVFPLMLHTTTPSYIAAKLE